MNSLRQLLILIRRIIKQNLTDLDTVITVIITPMFMLLFFVYILGGNISMGNNVVSNSKIYLTYSLPGFLLIAMSMGSAYTAVRINLDQTKGFLNRLHSLPIKRWVILGSHVVASVIFMLMAEFTIFIVGLLIGYDPKATLSEYILFILLSILFAFAVTLLAIPFSLKAKEAASASGFSYILLMLLFVSSALMPINGMAKPIKWFAKHQPMTPIVETSRNLLNNKFSFNSSTNLQAIIWLVSLIIIFSFLAFNKYKQVYTKK
ncbi:ABC transporter permease [Companilactobacillus sp. DQM5]|uniref:ABC transporter permease n=1 Tax=Companilactobacillus sp. DQM5 TaxID=3463359 RepID=UPI004057D907